MPLRLISTPSQVPTLVPREGQVKVSEKERRGIIRDRLGLKKLSPEIERLVREHMAIWDVTYEQALIAVLHRNPELLGRSTGSSNGMKIKDIGMFVHQKIMARMEETGEEYWRCYSAILDEDPDLRAIYANLQTKVVRGPQISPEQKTSQTAGATLHELTVRFMQQTGTDDYNWSLKQVLKANANSDLVRKYQAV